MGTIALHLGELDDADAVFGGDVIDRPMEIVA